MEPTHEYKISAEKEKNIFLSTGKTEKEIEKALKNKDLCALWSEVINESKVKLPCDKVLGNLLFELANKVGPNTKYNLALVSRLIAFE